MKKMLLFLFAFTLFAQRLAQVTWTAKTTTGTTSAYAVPATSVHTLAYVVTGSPSGCAATLEGSLDATVWFSLSTSLTCTSSGAGSVADKPVAFVRANLGTLSGGTAPTVTFKYIGR